ncbi:proline hydroxylase [Sphingomonas piscis]|uniref:Proline hydroxylase n=1 Tax=Sphingomonas piscis TaxID=2714943 RepID=A0A6G7YN56_9SPHN|nr:2OG-Fe(II) oxygenase family protein [Sphingomonas piscis]QIK78180.1 proline hydroxylase [Sphingomonas piscis]
MGGSSGSFSLHPDIDRQSLRRDFAEQGCVQIAPFISDDAAEELRDHVIARDDWRVRVLAGSSKPIEFALPAWTAMSDTQRQAIRQAAGPIDRDPFRYIFQQIVVIADDLRNLEPSTVLGRFAAFMSSDPVVELMRFLTGAPDIDAADASATRYGAGDFLTLHNDHLDEHGRRAAYVFGLTKEWRTEWGGLLQFHSKSGDILHGKVPRMNALTLFAVPQDHSVSQVSSFAPNSRYSVTGWLRAT